MIAINRSEYYQKVKDSIYILLWCLSVSYDLCICMKNLLFWQKLSQYNFRTYPCRIPLKKVLYINVWIPLVTLCEDDMFLFLPRFLIFFEIINPFKPSIQRTSRLFQVATMFKDTIYLSREILDHLFKTASSQLFAYGEYDLWTNVRPKKFSNSECVIPCKNK